MAMEDDDDWGDDDWGDDDWGYPRLAQPPREFGSVPMTYGARRGKKKKTTRSGPSDEPGSAGEYPLAIFEPAPPEPAPPEPAPPEPAPPEPAPPEPAPRRELFMRPPRESKSGTKKKHISVLMHKSRAFPFTSVGRLMRETIEKYQKPGEKAIVSAMSVITLQRALEEKALEITRLALLQAGHKRRTTPNTRVTEEMIKTAISLYNSMRRGGWSRSF